MKNPRLNLSTILILTLVLLGIGLVMVYNASSVEAFRNFGNKFFFARQQLLWTFVGLACLMVASIFPLPLLKKLAPLAFAFCLILMVVVLIPGLGSRVQGARRWINIGGFTLQPTELMKLSLVIYLATWLEKPQKLGSFLVIVALLAILTMLEPDLGTAIILTSTAFLVYYLSGAPLLKLAGIIGGAGLLGTVLIIASPYRRARLSTFLDPTSDPLGNGYHINQVLLALGSGGLTGVGLGRGRQKYEYLPEATTDSIFAVIAEEVGFLGSMIVIGLFLALIVNIFQLAKKCQNRFNQLLASGIGCWLASQVILNLSAMAALVPLTGIPLPFISYGGSSLVTTLTGIGLLINISRTERILRHD